MAFDDIFESYAKQFFGSDVLSGLTKNSPNTEFETLSAVAPLIIAPIVSPFMRRRKKSGTRKYRARRFTRKFKCLFNYNPDR